MKIHALELPVFESESLIHATEFVLEQLNLVTNRSDFFIYSKEEREVVLRNGSACSTFCTKKESCDSKFCNSRCKQIERGVKFIDNKLDLTITSCANLSDPYCEIRITVLS